MSVGDVDLEALNEYLGLTTKTEPLTPAQELDTIASALVQKRKELDALKEEVRKLEDAIIVRVPDEAGDFVISGDKTTVTVSRNELWKWDSELLGTKIVTAPVPDFVAVKYSIKKKEFQRQPEPVQKDFMDALTREPGAARIKIT